MSNETIQNMHRVLELQKSLNIKEGAPSLELRADRLDRVVSMVMKYENEIISDLYLVTIETTRSSRSDLSSRLGAPSLIFKLF